MPANERQDGQGIIPVKAKGPLASNSCWHVGNNKTDYKGNEDSSASRKRLRHIREMRLEVHHSPRLVPYRIDFEFGATNCTLGTRLRADGQIRIPNQLLREIVHGIG